MVDTSGYITYDSRKEDAFVVHKKDHVVKFTRTAENVYAHTPSQDLKDEITRLKGMSNPVAKVAVSHLIDTVAGNKTKYTDCQVDRATQARRAYHIAEAPTVENFKKLLQGNFIKNCPITTQDIELAEKIFGPDMSALKGKLPEDNPSMP